MGMISWDFLILYKIFFSQQVKRSVTVSNKHDIYELPYNMPNELRSNILENSEISEKSQIFIEL